MADSDQSVYIVVLNYNNFDCTDFCLQSLRAVKYPSIKIILVDNHSSDDSYDRLTRKYPECIGLRSGENLGFARGSNLGLRYAYNKGASHFMLLNNDVEVTPEFMTPMLSALHQNQSVGIVTPKIMYRGDKDLIWHVGGYIDRNKVSPVARGYNEIDKGQYDMAGPTEWASGACCLFSRELLDRIGFLEEKYFFGQEEWDFSTSAINAGFKIWYEPKAVVYHEIGQSSRKSPSLYAYQMIYNKFVYAGKFLPRLRFYWFTLQYTVYLLLFFPRKDLHHSTNSSSFYLVAAKKAALWGVRDYFRSVYITVEHLKGIDDLLFLKYKDAIERRKH